MTASPPSPALAGRQLEWKTVPEPGTMEAGPSSEQFTIDPAGRGQFARAELVPEKFVIDPAGQARASSASPAEDKVVRAASPLL